MTEADQREVITNLTTRAMQGDEAAARELDLLYGTPNPNFRPTQ
jgi:hypothetical protein